MKNKKLNLLFVCKYNVFRSKVAEAYFKKINKNKNIYVDSSGFIEANGLTKIDKITIRLQKRILNEKGLSIGTKSKGLSMRLMSKQDLIIIISDDLPNIFTEDYLKKNLEVRIWEIKDVTPKDYKENTGKTIDSIMKKVEKLVEELK